VPAATLNGGHASLCPPYGSILVGYADRLAPASYLGKPVLYP